MNETKELQNLAILLFWESIFDTFIWSLTNVLLKVFAWALFMYYWNHVVFQSLLEIFRIDFASQKKYLIAWSSRALISRFGTGKILKPFLLPPKRVSSFTIRSLPVVIQWNGSSQMFGSAKTRKVVNRLLFYLFRVFLMLALIFVRKGCSFLYVTFLQYLVGSLFRFLAVAVCSAAKDPCHGQRCGWFRVGALLQFQHHFEILTSSTIRSYSWRPDFWEYKIEHRQQGIEKIYCLLQRD